MKAINLQIKTYIYFIFQLILFFSSNLSAHGKVDHYSIKLITGKKLEDILLFVAYHRIKEYVEYPYLYKGDVEEELTDLSWFATLPHSAVAVAYEHEKPIGFVTGTSLVDYEPHFKGCLNAFLTNNTDPEICYYIADVIVLPEHRGNSLSRRLIEVVEKYAQNLGYKRSCLVTESHETHPLKPLHYKESDTLWAHLGYEKTSIHITFNWPTIQYNGQIEDQEHLLFYWMKNFYSIQN